MEIIIKDLTKSYKKIKAINGINMRLTPAVHGLLGPNGAGKTTLMKIVSTILSPTEGQITCSGRPWRDGREIKGNIGYLPQRFGMYKYLKVREALEYIAVLKKIKKNYAEDAVDSALEKTNMLEYGDRKVGQLSGGMLRRLGIAQAVLGDPDLLILDEPTVGLDPEERINFRKIIRNYSDDNKIILISSHIVSDLECLCDDLSVMNRGRIVVTGSVADIVSLVDGMVRECEMTKEAFEESDRSGMIIDSVKTENGYRARFIGNDICGLPVKATLEDSYAYIIKKDAEHESI